MHRCLECDHEFYEPKKYVERHGLETPPYEEFYGCPYCGGAFEEIIEEETDFDEELY